MCFFQNVRMCQKKKTQQLMNKTIGNEFVKYKYGFYFTLFFFSQFWQKGIEEKCFINGTEFGVLHSHQKH